MERDMSWDALLDKLENMSDEEFEMLADELDAMGDVPFAVAEIYDNQFSFHALPELEGVYCTRSNYNTESKFFADDCEDMEMAA